MKKFFIIITIMLIFALPINAQESSDNLFNEDIQKISDDAAISFEDVKNNPFDTIADTIKKSITQGLTAPLAVFYKITAVLLLSAIINMFTSQNNIGISQLVNVVSVLVIFYNVFESFSVLIEQTYTALFNIKNFLSTFLPVFASISLASGEILTSTIYTGFFIMSIVMVANFCINYIVPSINLFMAIGVTASISKAINLQSLCEVYSKVVKIAMTSAVSVLCFVLTLQTTITQSQDNLAIKTGKMLVTSAVPIIGSALQGAVGSVYAGMRVLKGFSGIVGILGVIQIFLPTITILAVNWCGFYAVIILSDILENKVAHDILSRFKDTVEILLSMTVLFLVLVVFSLSVMIKVTQGV